jgi:hypothetical protein
MAVTAVGVGSVIVRGVGMLMRARLAPVGMRPGMGVRVGQHVAVAMQITAQALVRKLFLCHWVLRLRRPIGSGGGRRLVRRQTGGVLTAFGAAAVTFMMLMYALESRSNGFILAFGCGCLLSSAYGFLAGTWPFGVVEAIWAVIAFRRYDKGRKAPRAASSPKA